MTVTILTGDACERLAELPAESVHCVVTSPPYWGLRDYGVAGQIGLESSFDEWLSGMVRVFSEVRRVLRDDGTLWLNIGDAYAATTKGSGGASDKQLSNVGSFHNGNQRLTHGLKPKDLLMMPARLALALQADGWWLRSEIVWAKPNPMPESVTDRPTSAHEKIYLLAKSARYFYDAEAVRENRQGNTHSRGIKRNPPIDSAGQGHKDWVSYMTKDDDLTARNLRNVWNIATAPFPEAHFATFPPALVEPCVKAGCPEGGTVLDPFGGSGTTGLVADRLGRDAILIELNPEYAAMARNRIDQDAAKRGQGPEEIMRGDGLPLFA